MSPRTLTLLALSALLAACSSQPEQPVPIAKLATPMPPAGQHELRGSLLGAPSGSEVELALLLVDERGLPREALGTMRLNGTGRALPFNLYFHPQASRAGMRTELRGRASLSGRLILRLPPRTLSATDSRTLGALQMVPAP